MCNPSSQILSVPKLQPKESSPQRVQTTAKFHSSPTFKASPQPTLTQVVFPAQVKLLLVGNALQVHGAGCCLPKHACPEPRKEGERVNAGSDTDLAFPTPLPLRR